MPEAIPREASDFVCTGCGLMCDDLQLRVDAERVLALTPPCPLAESYLLNAAAPRPALCVVAGLAVEMAVGLEHAAKLLSSARAPLVMGLERATVQAQRVAVEIADRIGGVLDPTDERGRSRSHAAVQTVGAVTATLGEIAARSELVVLWRCDAAKTHPRLLARLNRNRETVVVDGEKTATATPAGEFLQINEHRAAECLWTLRSIVRGVALDAAAVAAQTGVALDAWRQLGERLKRASYAAFFVDESASAVELQALAELLGDLHRHTRAAAVTLSGAGNSVGAAQVLTWQTGFPAAVDFSHGFPQYRPGECSAAALLARGQGDAALVIAADPLPHLSPAAAAHFRRIPRVVVDDRASATMQAAAVALGVARFATETSGDVFRCDGVALPLRAACTSALPPADAVLRQLADRLAELTNNKTP